MKRLTACAAVGIAVLASALGEVSSAHAATANSYGLAGDRPVIVVGANVSTDYSATRQFTSENGEKVTEEVFASAPKVATAAMIAASNNPELKAAAAGSTIYYKSWSQRNGITGDVWVEKHSGRFYYDGSHTWVDKPYRDLVGSHTCNQGYGVGVSIEVTSCSVAQIDRRGQANWDYYKTCVAIPHGPLCTSHNMHADGYNDGKMLFHNNG